MVYRPTETPHNPSPRCSTPGRHRGTGEAHGPAAGAAEVQGAATGEGPREGGEAGEDADAGDGSREGRIAGIDGDLLDVFWMEICVQQKLPGAPQTIKNLFPFTWILPFSGRAAARGRLPGAETAQRTPGVPGALGWSGENAEKGGKSTFIFF